MTDVINDVIINYESVNLDQTVDGIKQTSVALDGLVVASSSTEKATAAIEGRFKSLERSLGTGAATQREYEAKQKTINLALAQNPELAGRAAEATDALKAKYLQSGSAADKLSEAHQGLSTQAQSAFHAVRGFAEQVAVGIPITQALTSEMNHLTYAASGEGGLAGAFKQVAGLVGGGATWLASLVTPAIAVSAAFGTFGTVAVAAGLHWTSAQKDVENALKGIGKQSGATVQDINGIAQATSNTTNLTIGSARELATVFASTGKISKDNIALATTSVDGLAHSLGVDAADAAKLLAGALADPAKGMEELEAKTGAYDLKTQDLVRSLVRQGEVHQAQIILLNGVAKATQDAADKSGFWANRLKDLKNGFDLIGEDATKIAQVGGYLSGLGGVPTSGLSKQSQLKIAQEDLASFQNVLPDRLAVASRAGSDSQPVAAEYAKLADLTAQVEKLRAAAREEVLAPLNKELKDSATAADNAVNSYVPQIQKIRETEDAIKALTKAINDRAIAGTQANGGADDAAIIAAQNQLKILQDSLAASQQYNINVQQIAESYKGVSTQTALQLSAMDDQLRVLRARTASEKESAQYNKDINDALRSQHTEEDAIAIAADQARIRHEQSRAAIQAARDATLAWQADMLGVSDAARSVAASIDAANIAEENAQRAADAAQGGAFGGFDVTAGKQYTSGNVDPKTLWFAQDFARRAAMSVTDIINQSLGQGGLGAAISTAQQKISTGGKFNFGGIFGGTGATVNQPDLGALQSLYELKNAQTDDKATKVANLNELMGILQAQPETIARDQQIVQLNDSIKQLKQATDANTAATAATLNPLYSQGHGALAIGYYKAAGGLDVVAQGPTSGDQIPFMAMINGGERVTVQTEAQQRAANSNSRSVVNNNTFVFNNAKTSNARRSYRQFAQGFGQAAAASS